LLHQTASASPIHASVPRDWRRWVLAAGFGLLAISLIRTGWVSDDAYISFRTADNIIHGYGPVWNTSERVQAFTHPLWLGLVSVAFAATGEAFYTSIALSAAVTILAVAILMLRIAPNRWAMAVAFAALLSSKAFVDYSTSGLENPLSHLLLMLFVWQWWDAPGGTARLQRLSLIAALCMLNRLDLGLLVLPALAYETWRQRSVRAVRIVLVGMLPIAAWLLFATFYYGTPFPNTAYAKLNVAMPVSVRAVRGIDYYLRTLASDPATLPVIALAFVTVAWQRRSDWPVAAGIGLGCLYVVWVGGDFMMGRFFSTPFVMSVALLARAAWTQQKVGALVTASAIVVIGLLAPWEPAILSGYGYAYADNFVRGRKTREPSDGTSNIYIRQVVDERRMYSEFASLLKALGKHGKVTPDFNWAVEGLALRSRAPEVVVHKSIGLIGYFAGPDVHIIDEYGLSDPLLARLPGGGPTATMGHFMRALPAGYVETIEQRTNRIEDPDLAAYYDALHEIVSGPLWSLSRLQTTIRFLSGEYDHYRDSYLARPRPAPAG
jgi:arabinofuranosyltransferase